MVSRVVTVVEKQPIQQAPSEIAGMIVLRAEIAVLVLEKIDRHQNPLCEEPRSRAVFQRRTPVDEHQQQKKPISKDTFSDGLTVEFRPRVPPGVKIVGFVSIHRPDRSKKERHQVEKV